MKKIVKFLFTITAFLSGLAIINHLIFRETRRRNTSRISYDYYKWKYGNIRYITAGEGEPVLLIHGIGVGASLYEWERSIDALSKHYKVYALDLIGFGYSDKPAVSYSAYLYAQLICDFIKQVVKTPVYVAANSNSAAFVVAAANFTPDWFKKIILISPTGTSNIYAGNKYSYLRYVLELPIIGTAFYNIISSRFYIKYFLRKYVYSDFTAVNDELVNKYYYPAHFGYSNARYPLAAFMSGHLSADIERMIGKISVPIHVIWGTDNTINAIGNFNILKHNNPSISLTAFEGTKLLPHVEKPKTFYKVCRKFFK